MNTNEPRDDEILGRALSRAIETAEVEETPYERSRIGMRPPKRGTLFWRVAALAASVVLAGAFGAMLLESAKSPTAPVAQQPTATAAVTHTAAATATPDATPTAVPNAVDRQRVFVWRDGLPPTSQHLDGVGTQSTVEERIKSRVNGLNNPISALTGTVPRDFYVASVKVQGDLATIDYPGPAPVTGSTMTLALQQQIVYTATEEPGIRRVLVTANEKPMTIDQLVWSNPLTRDDVSGYAPPLGEVITEDQSRACAPNCPSPSPAILSNNYSVDTFAAGVARFVVQIDSGDWERFSVSGRAVDDRQDPTQSKYQLVVQIRGTERKPGLEIVDRSPLRSIRSTATSGATIYELALDDQRPWRVALLQNPDRIVVDVGGFARSISDTIAVYNPSPIARVSGNSPGVPRAIERQFTVSGLSRTFEATTAWRVRDSAQRIVASGFTTASRGTSALWGMYQISVQLPVSVSGDITLEVFWASPRDGSDVGLVQVPLVVR